MNEMSLLSQVKDHPLYASRESEYVRWYPKSVTPVLQPPNWLGGGLRGAYIHVPFCDRICKFCPFNKVLSDESSIEAFVKAIQQEIEMLSAQLQGGPLAFIYFGGGTPSVLDAQHIGSILETLGKCWGLSEDVEVTLETHPTHARRDYLRKALSAGVNRVSIGIQSFQDHLLSALGATHDSSDSHTALESARSLLDNVALDLIYSYVPQTTAEWARDLQIAVEQYEVPHISCYALVPNGSAVGQTLSQEDVGLAIDAFEYGGLHGLRHYASCASGGFDIAKPGYTCRYELEHWKAPQSEFVGLGPGAFGFAGGYATVNRLGVQTYCKSLDRGVLPLASAVRIDSTELRHRYFVLGVKALEIPLDKYRDSFQSEPLVDFASQFRLMEENGLSDVRGDLMVLTPVGRLYVDTCRSIFFSEDQRDVQHPEEPEIRALERLYRLE